MFCLHTRISEYIACNCQKDVKLGILTNDDLHVGMYRLWPHSVRRRLFRPALSNMLQVCAANYFQCSYVIKINLGYWSDMEKYVRGLMRSNIARRQERNINYAPEGVHIFPYPTNNLFITYTLLSQKA